MTRLSALPLALLLALVVATQAYAIAPALTVDGTFAPPTGVAADDVSPDPPGGNIIPDVPHDVAIAGDRIYMVGETRGGSSGGYDIGVIARRADGTLDPGFSGDGKLIIPVAAGADNDYANAIAVLPDGRLRIAGATDVLAGSSGESNDALVIGLNADGTPDTSFGTDLDPGAGVVQGVRFPATSQAATNDVARAIAVDGAGRLAVVGTAGNDAFVALLAPDGSPQPGFYPANGGVRLINQATAGLTELGVDVAFRAGGGIVALLQETNAGGVTGQSAVLHAVTATGEDDASFSDDGDLVLAVGSPDTTAGGLLAYGGRLWVTGATKDGTGTFAYLARVSDDGGTVDSRRFLLRGGISADTSITSTGTDLALVPGPAPTLVVGGTVTTSSGTYWAAGGFNELDRPLADLPLGSVAFSAGGETQETNPRIAAGPSFVAMGGRLTGTNSDASFGLAKLLVDANRACNLNVAVPSPLELTFTGGGTAGMDVKVTNGGTKACGGSISVGAGYRLLRDGVAGPVATGVVAAGQSVTLSGLRVQRTGALRAEDTVAVSVTADGDVDTTDNTALVHAVFRFCDLTLKPVRTPGAVPSEGARAIEVTVRNAGTIPCRATRVTVSAGGRRSGGEEPYTVQPGRSVSDVVHVDPAPARAGARVRIVLRAVSRTSDAVQANDTVTLRPRVVRVGDSDVRSASAGAISGTATGGAGRLAAARLRVARVEVAIQRLGRGCRWVTASGALASRKPAAGGACTSRVWLRATGTGRWRYQLRRGLGPGTYRVYSRAIIREGFGEAAFATRDRNLRTLRVG